MGKRSCDKLETVVLVWVLIFLSLQWTLWFNCVTERKKMSKISKTQKRIATYHEAERAAKRIFDEDLINPRRFMSTNKCGTAER